jgi:predicted transcriptional regulator
MMACIDPDGTLTVTATFLLKALAKRPMPPQEIAKAIGEPVFRVRGNLRELSEAGLIEERDGNFLLTDAGRERI